MVSPGSPSVKSRIRIVGVRIKFVTADGNTVPYPANFDEIRRNYGFIDTRGRPDRVAEIPEARESVALEALLTRLALPGARLVSLGCDLGQHEEPNSRLETRRVAGGYVQVIGGREGDHNLEFLRSVGKEIARGLKVAVGTDRWEVSLQLSPVLFKIEKEVQIQSVWIWFFAKASTNDRAFASRERLIRAIEEIVATFG
jgi:hypothetical protein